MDQKTERLVVVFLIIGGFAGSVILFKLNLPSIIVSIFLSTAVATTVYHFLGGISVDNQVTWGKVKLTGSIAVLIVLILIIDKRIGIKLPDLETMFSPSYLEWIPISKKGSPVNVEIKNIGLKDPLVIPLKTDLLESNSLTLTQEQDRYHVMPKSDNNFILGDLTLPVLSSLGFFQNIVSEKGMLYRTGQLLAGAKRAPIRNFLTDKELTFKITTGHYGNNLSGYYLVDENGREVHQGELGILQGEVVKVEKDFYLIFVLSANHELDTEKCWAEFGGYKLILK